jgi:hypothetical protein
MSGEGQSARIPSATNNKGSKKQENIIEENEQDSASKCQFCGFSDASLSDSEKMDLHFWRDCPLLTECKYCS